jgi:hypothetical protein
MARLYHGAAVLQFPPLPWTLENGVDSWYVSPELASVMMNVPGRWLENFPG